MAMTMNGEVQLAAPREVVWAKLNDAEPGKGLAVVGRERNLCPQRSDRRLRLTRLVLRDAKEKVGSV